MSRLSKITTMRFSVELLRRIERVARRDGMSRSAVVNKFVVAGLEQWETKHRIPPAPPAGLEQWETKHRLPPAPPAGALDC